MRLLIFGRGYTGTAIATLAAARGIPVTLVSRAPERGGPPGVTLTGFATAAPAILRATHLLATAAPAEGHDPVLAAHADAIRDAAALRWLGYLSTTGVYGDRAGGWVDETTPPAPGSDRSRERVAAEQAWIAAGTGRAVDIVRLAGIYGPGRSALDQVRAGTARRVIRPGQMFGRIHRDDIAEAVLAAASQDRPPGPRILNLADDEPAENAAVVAEAARLLGAPPPPEVPFEQAMAAMSPMGRSFWAENRRVSAAGTKAALGLAWRYPTYREGLRAILAEEAGDAVHQQ